MTVTRGRVLVVGFLLLCSLPGLAVPHYTLSRPSMGLQDFSTTACAVGGNRACWKHFLGGPKLAANAYSQWAVAIDAIAGDTIYAIDQSSGSLYKFVAGSWSVVSNTPAHLSRIVILLEASYMNVTTSDDELWHFDGTTWTDQQMKAILISGSMGALYIETPSFVLKRQEGMKADGPWTTISYPSGHGYIKGMASDNADTVWLDMQDGTLLKSGVHGVFQPITPPAKMNMIYAANSAAVLLSDEPVNNVYLFLSSRGTWTRLSGRLDNIVMSPDIWGFTSDGWYYHFQPKEMAVGVTVSGYYECNPSGCPPGSVHTATVNVKWGAGGVAGSGMSQGLPATTLNATATAYTFDCDPVLDPSDPACQFTTEGMVTCSEMGTVWGDSGGGGGAPPPSNGPAETWSKLLSQIGNTCYQQTNCNSGYPICYPDSNVETSLNPYDGAYECSQSYFWKYLWYSVGSPTLSGNITCFPNPSLGDSGWPIAVWAEKSPPPHYCTPRLVR